VKRCPDIEDMSFHKEGDDWFLVADGVKIAKLDDEKDDWVSLTPYWHVYRDGDDIAIERLAGPH